MVSYTSIISVLFAFFGNLIIVRCDKENVLPAETTTLRDGQILPLVGLGVGNLPHDLIKSQINGTMSAGTLVRISSYFMMAVYCYHISKYFSLSVYTAYRYGTQQRK